MYIYIYIYAQLYVYMYIYIYIYIYGMQTQVNKRREELETTYAEKPLVLAELKRLQAAGALDFDSHHMLS